VKKRKAEPKSKAELKKDVKDGGTVITDPFLQ
jgi:hypothetical protein